MVKSSDQSSLVKELLMGFCLGTANIIPGVSGGTFLLIFQIYERVFSILNNINKATIYYVCKALYRIAFRSEKRKEMNVLFVFLKDKDFIFLLKLIIGAVAAILCLSSLMKYLIISHFSPTYALFFGLILISIIIPVKMLRKKKAAQMSFLLLGAALTIYVTWAVNPYEKAAKKSDLHRVKYDQTQGVAKAAVSQNVNPFSFSGKYTPDEYGYAIVCGAVAVSAMVLPGISGSLVLILMGEYFEVVSAISGLASLTLDNFAFLGCFGFGIVFGGLFFAKLVSAILKRYYDTTMAFLIGLMVGSLYALWPFKKSIVMARQYIKIDGHIHMLENIRVYTNINQFPEMGNELYSSMVFFLLGCVIMSFFVKKEQKKSF